MEPTITAGAVVRALFAFSVASVPGLVLVHRFGVGRALGTPFRLALGCALALAAELVVLFAFSRVGSSFSSAFVVLVALAPLSLVFFRPGAPRAGVGLHGWAAIGLALVLLGIGIRQAGPLGASTDAIDHLATVRSVLETGAIEPERVFHEEGDGVTPDIRKGLGHAWLAALARLSGLDPIALWSALGPIALVIGGLAFTGLAVALLPPGTPVVLALALYPLLVHGNAAWFLETFLYPHNLQWIPIWCALALACEGLTTRATRAVFAALALSLPALHVFAPVLLLAALVFVLGGRLSFGGPAGRRNAREAAAPVLTAALFAAPITVYRLVTSHPALNPLHTEPSQTLYVLGPLQLHAIAPTLVRFGLPALVLAVVCAALLPRLGRARDRGALVGLCAGPLLVSLNPIAGAILVPRIGYLFVRFLGIVPFPIVAAALLTATGGRARRFGALVLGAALVLWQAPGGYANLRGPSPAKATPESWHDGFALVREHVPPHATILADPLTGYALPAYTGRRTVATLDQHASPSDTTTLERLEDVARALSPYRPLGEAVEVMQRRGARYVLLNESFDAPTPTYFDVRLPCENERVRDRFDASPGPFRLVGANGAFRLYLLVEGPLAVGVAARALEPPGRRDPATAGTAGAVPIAAGLSLVSASIANDTLERGDTLEVRLVLRKTAKMRAGTPYRIDARVRPLAGGAGVGFARAARVLGGRYPAGLWEVGEVIEDVIRIPVPGDTPPGAYEVGLRVASQPLAPNMMLADEFRYRGSVGEPVGTITIVTCSR